MQSENKITVLVRTTYPEKILNNLIHDSTRGKAKSKKEKGTSLQSDSSDDDLAKQYVQISNDDRTITLKQGSLTREKDRILHFDHIFRPSSKQEQIYENISTQLKYVLLGIDLTIVAYGAAKTGKTHTMVGDRGSGSGVIPRAISDLFSEVSKVVKSGLQISYHVELSYVELYNNHFRNLIGDLIKRNHPSSPSSTYSSPVKSKSSDGLNLDVGDSGEKIDVHDSDELGVFLSSNSPYFKVHVQNALEALDYFTAGNRKRTMRELEPHGYQSTRGHAILTLYVECRTFATDESWTRDLVSTRGANSTLKFGKLNLVDLAGGGRLALDASEETALESHHINLSIAAFGDCLHALGKNAVALSKTGDTLSPLRTPDSSTGGVNISSSLDKHFHVPYLNSKLSHLLKDSLMAKGKLVLIASIRPDREHSQQTLTTLKYASWAQSMRLSATLRMRELNFQSNREPGEDPKVDHLRRLLLARSQKFEWDQIQTPGNSPRAAKEVAKLHEKVLFSFASTMDVVKTSKFSQTDLTCLDFKTCKGTDKNSLMEIDMGNKESSQNSREMMASLADLTYTDDQRNQDETKIQYLTTQLATKEAQRVQLTQELQSLQFLLSATVEENLTLSVDLETHKSEVESLVVSKVNLLQEEWEAEADELRKDIFDLEERLDSTSELNKELESHLEASNRQIEISHLEHEEMAQKMVEAGQQIVELDCRVEELEQRLAESENNHKLWEFNTQQDLESMMTQHTQELAEKESELSEMFERINQMERESEEQYEEHTKDLKELDETRERVLLLDGTLFEREKQLSSSKVEVEEIKETLILKDSTIQQLEEELNSLKETSAEFENQINQMVEAKAYYDKTDKRKNDEIINLRNRLTELGGEHQQLMVQRKEDQKQLKDLQTQFLAREESRGLLVKELSVKAKELGDFLKLFEEAQAELENTRTALDVRAEELKELQLQFEQLQESEKHEKLEKQNSFHALSELQMKSMGLEELRDHLRKALAKRTRELSDVQEQFEHAMEGQQKAKLELESTSLALHELQLRSKGVVESRDQLKKVLAKRNKEMGDLQLRVDELEGCLARSEELVRELSDEDKREKTKKLLVKRTQELKVLEERIKALEGDLELANKKLMEKDEKLEGKGEQLKERDEKIRVKDNKLKEKDSKWKEQVIKAKELEEKLKQLECLLESNHQELAGKNEKIKELDNEAKEKSTVIISQEKKIEELEFLRKKVQSEAEEKTEALQGLEKIKVEFQVDAEKKRLELKCLLEILEEVNHHTERRLEEKFEEWEASQAELEREQKARKVLEEQLKLLQQQLGFVEEARANLEEENEKKDEELVKLEKVMDNMNQFRVEVEQQLAVKDEQIKEFSEIIEEMEGAYTEAVENLEKKEQELTEVKELFLSMEDRFSRAENSQQQFQEILDMKRKELTSLQDTLISLQKKQEAAEQDLINKRQGLKELQQLLLWTEESKDLSEEDLEKQNHEFEKILSLLRTTQEARRSLTKENVQIKEENVELQKKVTDMEKFCVLMEHESECKSNEISQLQQALEEAEATRAYLDKELRQKNQEVFELQRFIDSLGIDESQIEETYDTDTGEQLEQEEPEEEEFTYEDLEITSEFHMSEDPIPIGDNPTLGRQFSGLLREFSFSTPKERRASLEQTAERTERELEQDEVAWATNRDELSDLQERLAEVAQSQVMLEQQLVRTQSDLDITEVEEQTFLAI